MSLFAAVFVVLVLSEFHAPSPHGLPVGIVAPASVTKQVGQALGGAVPNGFDLQPYGSAAAARTAIAHGQIYGALVESPGGPQLWLAQAAGTAPTQALTTAFSAVAAHSGQSLAVTDVVPPLKSDSLALSPFFVILGVLIPSVVAGSSSALVFRRARAAWCVAAPVVAAAAIGAVAAGIADGVSGLGHYAALAGIVALFSMAVAVPTAALARIWPPLVALSVLVFVVVGLPASGGPSGLALFGPTALRVLHPALPVGVATSAVRGVVYFGGHGISNPLWVLAAWSVVGLVVLGAIVALRRRASAAHPVESPAAAPAAASAAGLAEPPPSAPALLGAGGIVVGFDNSGPGRRALDRAARLAAAERQPLYVVYADHALIDSDLSGFAHAEMDLARDDEAAAVAKAAADILSEADIAYSFERSRATPGDAILSAANQLAGRDGSNPVIVVGRSGHTAHHLLGSVPTHLLARSPFPVLAIP
jgi:nucleotide-binding universal stress UspA family protein